MPLNLTKNISLIDLVMVYFALFVLEILEVF